MKIFQYQAKELVISSGKAIKQGRFIFNFTFSQLHILNYLICTEKLQDWFNEHPYTFHLDSPTVNMLPHLLTLTMEYLADIMFDNLV